jgi:hypothetical protein
MAPEHSQSCLVLDMVGIGTNLRYVEKDGIFFPLHTDLDLNKLITKANPEATPLRETLRSGDYAVFVRHGWTCAALQTSGSSIAPIIYHTLDDKPAYIETQAIELTLETVILFIKLLEEYDRGKSAV